MLVSACCDGVTAAVAQHTRATTWDQTGCKQKHSMAKHGFQHACTNLMRMVLFSFGVALGVPTAEAEEAERETTGAPARLEGPVDVLVVVVAAAEPVGADAGAVAASQSAESRYQH